MHAVNADVVLVQEFSNNLHHLQQVDLRFAHAHLAVALVFATMRFICSYFRDGAFDIVPSSALASRHLC
jgi:hypothetical protein